MAKKKRKTRSQKIAKTRSEETSTVGEVASAKPVVEAEVEEFGYAKSEARHILVICTVFVAIEFGLWVLFTHTAIETTLSKFLSI